MQKLGFKELVPEEFSSHIITTYLLPDDPNFSFKGFYTKLAELGEDFLTQAFLECVLCRFKPIQSWKLSILYI